MTPATRRGLLRRGLVAGVAAALPAAGAPAVARAQVGGGDGDLINLLIALELLQARLYAEGLERVEGLDDETRAQLGALRRQEAAHARTLGRLLPTLGGVAVPERQVDFGGAFAGRADFLAVARRLEDTAVAAGNGVLAQLSSERAKAVVAGIVAAEAAQAAAVRMLDGESPLAGGVDGALSQSEVVGRLDAFLPEAG